MGGNVGVSSLTFLPPSPPLNNLFNDTADVQDDSVIGDWL